MFHARIGQFLTIWTAVVSMTGTARAGELPQEIINCRALLTADERLSCYDRVSDEDSASASDNISSPQSEPQPKASQTETASRTEPPTAEYDRVIDEDTASASDNVSSSQSKEQPKASQPETASRAVPPPTAEPAADEKKSETTSVAEGSQSQEALFGMSVQEKLEVARRESATEKIDQIEAVISEMRYSRTGKPIITLDNGHIWQQLDSENLRLSENDSVVIRRASLGSYLLKKAGSKRSMRVKRIR